MCVLEFIWEIFFCSFSYLFQIFCVKRSDDGSGCPDGVPGCPVGVSGCPDDKVDSSGRPFSLPGQAC
jgi:hypothetical protein